MQPYNLLKTFFPTRPLDIVPRRIVLIHPCCIGDVMLATATLKALRQGWPDAHITWAVGGWSKAAVADHDLLDAVMDTGSAANPAAGIRAMLRMTRQLRAGNFDLAVSLVRSPWMSMALGLSGIPHRAGLDSGGRGFGYSLRVPVDPNIPRHEAEIYLDVARALGLDTDGCYVNVPVRELERDHVRDLLAEQGITGAYAVLNPAGGSNPGMVMDAKRWPPENFAALGDALADIGLRVVLLGGPDDRLLLDAVAGRMQAPALQLAGMPTFGQIAALAHDARVYIGNDTGLTHLAAAAGAKTVMILGPSDPARYAPFVPDALALWKTVRLIGGVDAGAPPDWNWKRDGISPEEAIPRVLEYVQT